MRHALWSGELHSSASTSVQSISYFFKKKISDCLDFNLFLQTIFTLSYISLHSSVFISSWFCFDWMFSPHLSFTAEFLHHCLVFYSREFCSVWFRPSLFNVSHHSFSKSLVLSGYFWLVNHLANGSIMSFFLNCMICVLIQNKLGSMVRTFWSELSFFFIAAFYPFSDVY